MDSAIHCSRLTWLDQWYQLTLIEVYVPVHLAYKLLLNYLCKKLYISIPLYSCVRQYTHNLIYCKHNGDDKPYDSVPVFVE